MSSDQSIYKLKSDGFVNSGQVALSAKESAELRRLAQEVCNNLNIVDITYTHPINAINTPIEPYILL